MELTENGEDGEEADEDDDGEEDEHQRVQQLVVVGVLLLNWTSPTPHIHVWMCTVLQNLLSWSFYCTHGQTHINDLLQSLYTKVDPHMYVICCRTSKHVDTNTYVIFWRASG